MKIISQLVDSFHYVFVQSPTIHVDPGNQAAYIIPYFTSYQLPGSLKSMGNSGF